MDELAKSALQILQKKSEPLSIQELSQLTLTDKNADDASKKQHQGNLNQAIYKLMKNNKIKLAKTDPLRGILYQPV